MKFHKEATKQIFSRRKVRKRLSNSLHPLRELLNPSHWKSALQWCRIREKMPDLASLFSGENYAAEIFDKEGYNPGILATLDTGDAKGFFPQNRRFFRRIFQPNPNMRLIMYLRSLKKLFPICSLLASISVVLILAGCGRPSLGRPQMIFCDQFVAKVSPKMPMPYKEFMTYAGGPGQPSGLDTKPDPYRHWDGMDGQDYTSSLNAFIVRKNGQDWVQGGMVTCPDRRVIQFGVVE